MSIAHSFMRIHIHRACFMSIARYELCSYFGPMYEHSSCMIIFLSCMSNVYHGHFHDPYQNIFHPSLLLCHRLMDKYIRKQVQQVGLTIISSESGTETLNLFKRRNGSIPANLLSLLPASCNQWIGTNTALAVL